MSEVIIAKIAALRAAAEKATTEADALQGKLDNAAALNAVKAGDKVRFTYGRKETRTVREGEVLARFTTDKGDRVKILSGRDQQVELYELAVGDLDAIVPSAIANLPANTASGNLADALAGLK